MEGSTAANAPMPMIQQRDASQDRRWGSLHEPANIAVPKRSFGEISDPSQSWAKNRSVTLAPRPQDSMALTAWSMLLVVDGTCKVPACSDDKECLQRDFQADSQMCSEYLGTWGPVGNMVEDVWHWTTGGWHCYHHNTRKLPPSLHQEKRWIWATSFHWVFARRWTWAKGPPLSPMSLPFHIWQMQHMRGHDSSILLFHAAIARCCQVAREFSHHPLLILSSQVM